MKPQGNAMTPGELAKELGISSRTLARQRDSYAHLLVSKPVGRRIYSRILLEQHLRGERVVNFGRGRLLARAS